VRIERQTPKADKISPGLLDNGQGVLMALVRASGLDGAGDDLLDLVPATRIEGEVFRGSRVAVDRVYGVHVGGGEFA